MAFTNSFTIPSFGAKRIEVDVITGGENENRVTGFFIDDVPVDPTSSEWIKIASAEETKFIVNQFNATNNQPLKFLSDEELLELYERRIGEIKNSSTINDSNLPNDSGTTITNDDGDDGEISNRLGSGLRRFKRKTSVGALAYPIDINKDQDYLQIDQYLYRPPNARSPGAYITNPTRGGKYGGTVILPMPKVSDSNASMWGEHGLNIFGLAAAATGGFVASLLPGANKGAAPDPGNFLDSATEMAENFLGGAQIFAAQTGASAIQSATGNNISADQLLARTTGNVANPNAELLFQGPTLRNFSFTYTLVARNSQEGTNIRRIIKFFKVGLAPKRLDASLLGTPNIFALKYNTLNNNKPVNKFKDMALSRFTVDYAPSGFWTAYDDSQPVAVQISFEFTELQPIYDIDQLEYSEDDVGY